MPEGQITTLEASKRMGVTLGWVYMLIRCGELPATKNRRQWFVPADAVEARKRASKGIGARSQEAH